MSSSQNPWRAEDMSNPTDPRVDVIVDHLNQQDEAQRRVAAENLARESYKLGVQQTQAQVRQQQFIENARTIVINTANDILDAFPAVIPEADRKVILNDFFTEMNARAQTDDEVKGMFARGEIEQAESKVLSRQLATHEKYGATVQQVAKHIELSQSENLDDVWESGIQEAAMSLLKGGHKNPSSSGSDRAFARSAFGKYLGEE